MTALTLAGNELGAIRDRVDAWHRRLGGTRSLSPRYRMRYAIVLAQLEQQATAADLTVAQAAVSQDDDAGRAVAVLATGQPVGQVPGQPVEARPILTGSGELLGAVTKLVDSVGDVTAFLTAQPHLELASVPLHPAREARLVRHHDAELVALRWSGGSVPGRSRNQELMVEVLEAASAAGPLQIRAHEEYVHVASGDADPWVFAPNLGVTLEDRLRWDVFVAGERDAVIGGLTALRRAMLRMGRVWQGFAPRNMFLRDGELVLIDFEEVVDTASDPVRASECLLWHRVFFADCLSSPESASIFAPAPGEPVVQDNHQVEADPFERALLGLQTVAWRQRRQLLQASAALEGRHRRATSERDGGFLFGHELGHFWGDFLPAADEARLFEQLSPVATPVLLTGCLEVFEAAMEADICRSLRLRAHGTIDISTPRTEAAIEVLAAIGAAELARHRSERSDWYEALVVDPGHLVDTLLHTAGATIHGLDREELDRYLVGGREARLAHEAALTAATDIGLDFLHRDDEPFLRYLDPDQLRATVGGALPTDGAPLETVLADVEHRIVRYAVAQSHRAYLAFPDAGNAVSAVAGGVLGRLLNQNLIAVDRSAPSATFVEIQVIEWLRELIGYETAPIADLDGVRDVAGLWATGGHLSNHIAMLAALGRRFPDVRQHGLRRLRTQPTVVLAGPIAHYSHSDAAFHLGLGWDAVISVDACPGYTTDPAAVEAALADPTPGTTPFMVVGVAGNCRTTGLDDLEALAEVCRRHGVWFHVDACHGGSMIFSEQLRTKHLRGIELADSVALDPHKGLVTPYPSSYVVFRERGVLNQFSRHQHAVTASGCWDLGLITPFLGSRGFESLATWMLLRHVGVRRLGDIIESRHAHVRYLERRIDDTDLFVRLNDVDFYRMAFVFCPLQARRLIGDLPPDQRARAAKIVSRYTSRLNTGLYRSGQVCFDEHTLADLADRVGTGAGTTYTIMAACPGNPLLTRDDLDAAMDRLTTAAALLVPELMAALRSGTSDLIDLTDHPTVGGPAGWSDTE